MDSTVEKMIEAAKAGGAEIKKYFGKVVDVTEKSVAGDYQTKADLESEKAILAVLRKEFPGYNIHSEEEGETNNNHNHTFYIDPLDGTNNFVLGVPNFMVSIGLVKDKTIIAGVLYQPITDQVVYAAEGKGAYLDDKKISVNSESRIPNATIEYAPEYSVPHERSVKVRDALLRKNFKRILSHWASTVGFSSLASGKSEGEVLEQAYIYDFCAGKIIAREAGAKITNFNGQPEENDLNNSFIITNGQQTIHDALVEIFR